MSVYGYHRLTTPPVDPFATEGVPFERHLNPSVLTTAAYASLFTGMDCFGTDVVGLRHKVGLGPHVTTLAEILAEQGYNTTCVSVTGNPAARGFQPYLDYGGWGIDASGRSPKAENRNGAAIPELDRFSREEALFLLFLRHMDPHAPYLLPGPFERVFYGGDGRDPDKQSTERVFAFKPFVDNFRTWIPEACTDSEYVAPQYDGAVASMDACMQNILARVQALGSDEATLIVFTADHGESLDEHECYFDHPGMYDCTLVVPCILRFPLRVPRGLRIGDVTLISDVLPKILDLLAVRSEIPLPGWSLAPLLHGRLLPRVSESYITETTWMRKHGWRMQEWKHRTSTSSPRPNCTTSCLIPLNCTTSQTRDPRSWPCSRRECRIGLRSGSGRRAVPIPCSPILTGIAPTAACVRDAPHRLSEGSPSVARSVQGTKGRRPADGRHLRAGALGTGGLLTCMSSKGGMCHGFSAQSAHHHDR